ncbi:MAG: hypothetical protein P3W89_000755, partial [Aquificaceae bacterium]|nr:hypothetical protein [Aquificaceae bacterium]
MKGPHSLFISTLPPKPTLKRLRSPFVILIIKGILWTNYVKSQADISLGTRDKIAAVAGRIS